MWAVSKRLPFCLLPLTSSHAVSNSTAVYASKRFFIEDSENLKGRATASEHDSTDKRHSFDQFQAERMKYSRSFHDKTDAENDYQANNNNDNNNSNNNAESESEFSDTNRDNKKTFKYKNQTSKTVKERRAMTKNWENAFFGSVHYEKGMHERYAAAVEAEETEKQATAAPSPPPDAAAYRAYQHRQQQQQHNINYNRAEAESEMSYENCITWPDDEAAPLYRLRALPPTIQLEYILRRLTMAERHIRFAADYGSLRMMAELHLGERWLAECEDLLKTLGWWNDEIETKVTQLREEAARVEYDYDLD